MMKRFLTISLAVLLLSSNSLFAQITSTWDALPYAPSSQGRFEDIFFISPTHGWAITLQGFLLKTTDGLQWSFKQTNPVIFDARSLAFHDSLRGWLGTLNSFAPLYGTTDGGKTWTKATITGPAPKGICGLKIVNDSVVYGTGKFSDTARIVKTTDGGKSWKSIDLSAQASSLVDCYFSAPDSGIVVGGVNGPYNKGNAVVLSTTDGGKSWQNIYTSTRKGEQCWKIYFRTALEGYIAVQCMDSAKYYLKTTDGGKTWTEKLFATFSGSHTYPQGMAFTSEKHGWIGGWGDTTFTTSDGGNTWQQNSHGLNVNRFRRINDTLTYVGGERIYRITTRNSTSVFTADAHIFPASISPNPTSKITQLRFEAERGTWVIRVTDALGHEVFKRNGESAFKEDADMQLDVSAFAAGVYYCEIITGSKRMVLPLIVSAQ